MALSYDTFSEAFLEKITDYDLLALTDGDILASVDGFMKRAISAFRKNCKYDLSSTADDTNREFAVDVLPEDLDELTDIISEGMVVQWLKPYANQQDLLRNVLNTRDFITYSPAEMLMRVGNAYRAAKKDYTQMIREYSYNHGRLEKLHL